MKHNKGIWDQAYQDGRDDWNSKEIPRELQRLVRSYLPRRASILEAGCGIGHDAMWLAKGGYQVTALDWSAPAIYAARQAAKHARIKCRWIVADFLSRQDFGVYHAVYDKGVFHNLAGDTPRTQFVEKVVFSLGERGIWINVSGSADPPRSSQSHGMVFLNDIIRNVEPYFEILEVKKGKYGRTKVGITFPAWFCVFRRR